MANPKRRAARVENELANILWEDGFAVVRGPSSGGGARKRFQPDLVAIKDGKVLVFEVKLVSRDSPLYIDSEQVVGLSEFARRAGGSPYIAVRLKGGEWRFHPLSSLRPAGSSFRLDSPSEGLRLRDLEEAVLRAHEDLTRYLEGANSS